MIADYARLALRNIGHRKLRSWLTLIGILIGITAVVALISLSVGMQNAIKSEFETIGANRIVVAPGGYFFGPGSTGYSTATFDEDDLKAVRRANGIEAAVPVLSQTARIEFKKETTNSQIIGGATDPETLKVTRKMDVFQVDEGRQIDTGDTYVVSLSQDLAYDTFERDVRVGNKVKIEGEEFKVIGITKEAHIVGSSSNIPLETAREIFDEPDEISNIFVIVKEGYTPKEVAEDIKKELRQEREVEEGEEDFYVQTAQQVIDTFTQILAAIQAVLIGIAGISLLVGGVGIMNTMFTSIVERTKEIGIMKSVGATNNTIALLFMIESGILGMLGGILGIIFGLGIGKAAQYLAKVLGGITLVPESSLILILGALAFSFIIGMLAGLWPAIQATKLQPVEALRK